jgi:diacylglycerol kinase family enzyme
VLEQPRIYAQVDGEPCGRLPVEFRVVPEMLTMLVPQAGAGR